MERPKRKSAEGVARATKQLAKKSRIQRNPRQPALRAVDDQGKKKDKNQRNPSQPALRAVSNQSEELAVDDQGKEQAVENEVQTAGDEEQESRCAKCTKSSGTGKSLS